LRPGAETHRARGTLSAPAGSGPAGAIEATRATERLQVAGLPVGAGFAAQVERLTGALVRHAPARDRGADWRLAA
jgi:hypothetical protein